MTVHKGISPLIAAVLLIAFTMAIASIFAQWVPDLLDNTQQSVSDTSDTVLDASQARLDISQASYSSGSGNITVVLQNSGQTEMNNFTITAYGEKPVQRNVDFSLSQNGIATVELNTSSKPDRVEVSSRNLPVSAEEETIQSSGGSVPSPMTNSDFQVKQ
ncbi:MAG: hypothetical protein H8Z69_00010 [Nanohaloarchaea archaeon]|nr:hypothetical protein [Candidatus Nanohaloarchaea archaeon]